ncbi:MAG TPA: heme biosynthesis HemY N-terminal domain-containing protein [Gammaproteobacteria bacterium]|jgi:HemY protein|nr:heme biosynthesis HemY N-terminal domain-containing protein [Gammaproteobacteria bacterium]
MKYMFFLLLVLLAAVIVAGVAHIDNGYALLAWHHTSIEMSLGTLIVVVLFIFFGLYLLTKLVTKLWAFPRRIREALLRRRELRARRATTRGLIDLAEGRWKDSEKHLMRRASDSEMPLITYIAAARAAQAQGAHERRDNYLHRAYEQLPAAHLAVLLTQAELQIAHRQNEQALATLHRLLELHPNHAFGLKLLARLYKKLGDWERLRALTPAMRDQKSMDATDIDNLEALAVCELMEHMDTHSAAVATKLWDNLPRRIRNDVTVLRAYVQTLIRCDEHNTAESVARDALKSHWDEELIVLYGKARSDDPIRQLARVENWLGENGESAALLLTAGRLCVVAKLWGKARGYLESSIVLGGQPEAYEELGRLLKSLDDTEAAIQVFSDGLAVSIGRTVKAYKPGKSRLRRVKN